jgi:hypothetical protein
VCVFVCVCVCVCVGVCVCVCVVCVCVYSFRPVARPPPLRLRQLFAQEMKEAEWKEKQLPNDRHRVSGTLGAESVVN